MGSQSSVPWDPNGMFWLAQKWLTLFTFVAPINMLLLVDAMNWDLTYKDLIKKILCNTDSNKWIIHRCESCPGTATLKEFLDQKLNKHEDDDKFNYCQWDTTDWAMLTIFSATCEECKVTLIDAIDDLTRHFYIAKQKNSSSWYRTKSKAITGVKNIASYIPWLYTTWDHMVASNMIQCVLVLRKQPLPKVFCIKFKQCLFISLKLITHI